MQLHLLPGSVIVCSCNLHVCLFFYTYVVEKGGVSVAVLEASGPALIVHCVCQWLVKNQVLAEFVARIPDDPLAVVDAGG